MNIGTRIKNCRLEKGLTQSELAKRMGYTSKTTICKVESGNDNITLDRVEKFARALGVTPSYLMGWDSDEEEFDDIVEITTADLDEADLLECYRELSELKKKEARRFIEYLLYSEGK